MQLIFSEALHAFTLEAEYYIVDSANTKKVQIPVSPVAELHGLVIDLNDHRLPGGLLILDLSKYISFPCSTTCDKNEQLLHHMLAQRSKAT